MSFTIFQYLFKMKINRKGEFGELLFSNVSYLVLLIIFFVGILYFVMQQQEGAGVWEDYYAKEIVKMIDFSNAGDNICLDVHRATEIAQKNNVKSFSEIFGIDNVGNEVCVKLSKGRKTCFSYFNRVDVVNVELKLAEGRDESGRNVNLLCFNISDVQKKEGGENA